MRYGATLLVAIAAALLSGCPSVITVDGQTVVEDEYHRALELVKDAAGPELDCPRNRLQTKVLSRTVHATVDRFKVAGCGREAVFVRQGPDGYAREAEPPVTGSAE